jgi:allophanate hydrolase
MARLEGFDALVVPTAPFHPALADVAADPVGVNSRMGTYTNFCNLFDLCAVAVPAGEVDGSQFGLTVVGRTFEDAVAADIARRIQTLPLLPASFAAGAASAATAPVAPEAAAGTPWPVRAGATAVPLVVVGAHRQGQPLAHELESIGAAWDGEVRTAARYRMVALDTQPPKPGVYRSDEGAQLVAERWLLPEAGLGNFLAALPEPMLLGSVRLADGSTAVGFACDAVAAASGRDITRYGDWLAALAGNPPGRDATGPEALGEGKPGQETPGPAARETLREVLLTGFARGLQPSTSRAGRDNGA